MLVGMFIVLAVGGFWLYLIFKLHWISLLLVYAFLCGMLFVHLRMYQKHKNALLHFEETILYIESMLMAFQREGKIEASLRDVVAATKAGRLHSVIEGAYNHIQITFDESEVLEDTLAIIEKEYNCKRVNSLHRLLVHAEWYGGETKDAIALMQEDCKRWQLRIHAVIAERKKAFREILLSVAASLAICGCILHLPIMGVDVSDHILVQILSVILIFADDLIIVLGQRFLCESWETIDCFGDGLVMKQKLIRFRSYNEKKERRPSIVLGIISLLIAIAFFAFGYVWIAAFLLLVMLLLFNQHKLGHWICKRAIEKEIRSAFPSWLVDLTLLLQSENVHNAICKSRVHAPGVLAEDLRKLENELAIDPESSRPYHNFLKEFELPQIASAMGMLYSLSSGNTKDGNRQLIELVNGNYKLQDDAEKVRLHDKGSGMYLLFLAPVLTASLKLVIDMAIFMISFVGKGIQI